LEVKASIVIIIDNIITIDHLAVILNLELESNLYSSSPHALKESARRRQAVKESEKMLTKMHPTCRKLGPRI
jgi:hypothetical protein